MQVAEELFARNGFAATSLREIGVALGIANASIIYHFPSKKKLYAAVLSRVADSVRQVTEHLEQDTGDPVERIRLMVDRFMAWGEVNPRYMQLVVRELMENRARISRARTLYLADVVDALRRPIEQARQHGCLWEIDPELFLLHLIGSITYFIIAVPTVSRITNTPDIGDLLRRFRESIHQVISTCLAAASSGGSPAGARGR